MHHLTGTPIAKGNGPLPRSAALIAGSEAVNTRAILGPFRTPTAEHSQTRNPDNETMRSQPLAACLALALTLSFGIARAQTPSETPAPAVETTPAALVGKAENGRVLAYTCQGCHGLTGYKNAYPSYKVPKIGGQSAQYLSQALNEYRDGNRQHPTMQAQSMSFTAQEIADISAYLSTLK